MICSFPVDARWTWFPLDLICSSVWAVVVHRVNTRASVMCQLFIVYYFVKVTHGVPTNADGAAAEYCPPHTPNSIYKEIFLYKWIQVHVYYI